MQILGILGLSMVTRFYKSAEARDHWDDTELSTCLLYGSRPLLTWATMLVLYRTVTWLLDNLVTGHAWG
jgi:hypothetical protein